MKDEEQQMEKTIEVPNQNETETFLSENDVSNDEWTRPNNLNFPWALIDLITNSKEVFQIKSNIFKHFWTPFIMAHLPCDERVFKRYLISLAQIITAFLIFWFFLGHIWLVQSFIYSDYYCNKTILVFSKIMFPIQYPVGIWLLHCCIQNNSRVLPRRNKNIP
ncbi:unnamed protein product [Adineta steineri]|uniref:Uncharacterized protein n=1 Tax=Adineta steineri TaxID=433720 RepID=A0A819PBL8_9BILA|nr:unnamed protein product [Adineta steineri]